MARPLILLCILTFSFQAHAALADIREEAAHRFRTGDIAGARDLLIELAAAGHDTSHAATTTLFDLGACHLRLGELAPARRCFESAVAGFEARPPGSSVGLALALEGLAATLLAQDDPASAHEHVERARRIRAEIFEPRHPQLARLDALAGRIARLEGRLDEATEAMERAKQAYRQIHGNVHPTVTAMVSNFVDLYLEQDNPLDAQLMARQADYITRQTYGVDAPERVASLATLGRVRWELGRHVESAQAYGEALSIIDTHGRTSLLDAAACEQGLGLAYLAAGRIDDALAALTRATAAYERAWWLAGDIVSRAEFMASPYPLLAAAELLTGGADADSRAWSALQHHHGRTVRHGQWLTLLTTQERAQRNLLMQRCLSLDEHIIALAADGDTQGLAVARAERVDVETELAGLERRLQDRVASEPSVAGSALPVPPESTALMGWLDVSIAPDRPLSWAWTITPDGGLAWTPLDPVESVNTTALASKLRSALATGDRQAIDRMSRRIHHARIAPCLGRLAGASSLMVVPGDAMAGLPVSMLRDGSGRYLQERFAVTVMPWIQTTESPSATPSIRRTLLAVADPPFTDAHAAAMRRGIHHSDESVVSRGLLTEVVRGDRSELSRLSRLPATRREVEEVSKFFDRADMLVGSNATEGALSSLQQSGDLAHYDIIHLATHALVDAARPQQSSLVLSQVATDAQDDGLLTADEVTAGWRLNADLVTLSACETGLGRPAPGEGYLGFTQSFLVAGARSVLVSLWQVDDRATSLLMTRFYANLQERGLGKAESLREAKGWLRGYEAGGRRVFEDERYWAGFVLVGAGR